MKLLSIIIPVLNEAETLPRLKHQLRAFFHPAVEIIVVDGGSNDASATLAGEFAHRVVTSPAGRAKQMNAGAAVATGAMLLFLHADTVLPAASRQRLLMLAQSGQALWGRFDVRLSGRHRLFRVIEGMMNLRSRLTGVATGDQAIFVHRRLFAQVGGYPDIPLMEDIALSKRLRALYRPVCLRLPVVTSSRRWETYGIVRTVMLMWWLRLLYFLGVSPHRLKQWYA